MKKLLCGNEAIAQGAYEAGIRVATSYPGTPATEIMEYLLKLKSKDFYAEWSTNEKVALEICLGISTMGQRSLCSMKSNGLNICIDTLMSLTKKGIKGGMVIVVVDDPDVRYSNVVQDSRKFIEEIGFPIFEPETVEECLNFTMCAFRQSETLGTPIFIRITNKLAHLYEPIETGKRIKPKPAKFDTTKYKFNPYSKEQQNNIPYFCHGCPHEAFYKNLVDVLPKDYIINGDIGCYEIAGFGNNGKDDKPLRDVIDTLFVMGSGVNVAQGQLICGQKNIALCGDGTFWHSGINGLINAVHNKHKIILFIMDNNCIAMTGQQDTVKCYKISRVCKELGCSVFECDPYKKDSIEETFKGALIANEHIKPHFHAPSVIIVEGRCTLKNETDN